MLSGVPIGVRRIEGMGAGFVMPLWDPTVIDEIRGGSSEAVMTKARELARREGIFAGTSTGANLVGALAAARSLGPGAAVVTVMCDTDMKYLSTAQYGAGKVLAIPASIH